MLEPLDLPAHLISKFLSDIKTKQRSFNYKNPNLNSNKKILFLTDMTIDIQIKKLINLNIFSSNISIVTSEEFGIEKPSILLYNYAINKLKLLPTEICTIGDNYEKDIVPSIHLNLIAYWYNKYNNDKNKIINNNKCFIINDYSQLNYYFNE